MDSIYRFIGRLKVYYLILHSIWAFYYHYNAIYQQKNSKHRKKTILYFNYHFSKYSWYLKSHVTRSKFTFAHRVFAYTCKENFSPYEQGLDNGCKDAHKSIFLGIYASAFIERNMLIYSLVHTAWVYLFIRKIFSCLRK